MGPQSPDTWRILLLLLLLPLLSPLQALMEALATNSSLQELDLRSNAIGLTGCRMLSALLQDHNSSIRALHLAGSLEEPDGTQAPVLQVCLCGSDACAMHGMQCVFDNARRNC
jgi:Ran GTPase-activating protein (RanGAP) involved in mRNA processing and transport